MLSIDQIKQDVMQDTMFAHQTVYIFDEADKLHPNNIAKLKTVIDTIDRRRQANLPCNVTVIFTSAKTKRQLTAVQQMHWDELATRCGSAFALLFHPSGASCDIAADSRLRALITR